MNFPPFGGHFSTAIPTIHQFAAKFSQETTTGALCQTQDNSNRYTANGVPSFTQHHPATHQQMLNTINTKYQGNYPNQTIYGGARQEKRQSYEPQELAQELCAVMLQQSQQHEKQNSDKSKQELLGNERRSQQTNQSQQQSHPHSQIHSTQQQNITQTQSLNTTSSMPATWQSLATPGSAVADYLSHLPASTLPLSLHHFLKYSAENIKKESTQQLNLPSTEPNVNLIHNNSININGLNGNGLNTNVLSGSGNLGIGSMSSLNTLTTINTAQIQNSSPPKKKKKKKPEKEKKPRPKPGESVADAIDSDTFCFF